MIQISSRFVYVDRNSTAPISDCGFTCQTACPTIYDGFLAANSGDTILIEPGYYSGKGNEDLTSANLTITSLNILGNGPQEKVIIQCQGEHRFLQSQSNFLQSISNITIKNCSSLGRVVIVNQDGGALLVTDSADRLTITNTTFQNNLGINGGAISIDNGYLYLVGCTFLENKAGYWGGAILSISSSLTVLNSFFAGNAARGDLIDSIFVYDIAEAGKGGGIYAYRGPRMTIRGSTFMSNSGQIAGGALFAKLVSGLDILSSQFLTNSALGGPTCSDVFCPTVRGGALLISDTKLDLQNCTFIGNEAITTDVQVLVRISPSFFFPPLSNFKQFSQGGVFVITSDLYAHSLETFVSNCTFINNTAKGLDGNKAGGYGGAIFTSKVPFILTMSKFFGNRAESPGEFTEYLARGGALYVTSTTEVDITKTVFQGNVVESGQGGAIFLIDSSSKFHLVDFFENRASSSYEFEAKGGALTAVSYSDITIDSCIFHKKFGVGQYSHDVKWPWGCYFFPITDRSHQICHNDCFSV